MTRLILTPTLLAAIPASKSRLGRSIGTIAWYTGAVTASPIPMRKTKTNKMAGVTRCSHTSARLRSETDSKAMRPASLPHRVDPRLPLP